MTNFGHHHTIPDVPNNTHMSGKLIYAGNLHTTVDANEITLVNYAAISSARMQGKRW